jgi:pSer/pThr/pTyr-binding forkhead associated (FHA) protein
MALITLQVLDGADKGRAFENLPTPITIGREEGNTLQLNDERVSRYHLKIQEDNNRVVLTDLQSTNGTKVNGEDMQLRILRFGDLVTLGRTVLLFGSRDQIADRLKGMRADGQSDMEGDQNDSASLNYHLYTDGDPRLQDDIPPELPDNLSPGQAAQLNDALSFFHLKIRYLLESIKMDKDAKTISLQQRHWQSLLDMQMQLATYLRQIGEPDGEYDDSDHSESPDADPSDADPSDADPDVAADPDPE